MGEIHFSFDNYSSQGLIFGETSYVNDNPTQALDCDTLQLHNCIIEFKETCREFDDLHPCCSIDCTIYDENYQELGKFRSHVDREDRLRQYKKNQETNQFELIKEYTLKLSNLRRIA